MNYATLDEALRGGDACRAVPRLCHRELTEIAQGRRELIAVRHPLGFVCLPVYRQDEYGVCIHVWTVAVPPARSTTSTVHSHSWDLVSFVLYGRVGNRRVRVVDDPRRATARVFEVYSQGDVDEIRATPRLVHLVEESHRVAGPGDLYRLRAGEFHATVVPGEEAATVVLGRARSVVDLSLGPPDTPSHRLSRQLCSTKETIVAARVVMDRLAAGCHADGEVR
jgi:hypothetical protein